MAPRILVVDDSAVVRHAVRLALTGSDLDIIEAVDGAAALDLIAGERPDVILLDVEMPGLDGLTVLRRLRGQRATEEIPVILLTARGGSTDVVTGLEDGAHDYLTKPFEPAELAARVKAALRTVALIDLVNRRNAELDHFASKAAHDLKSPLTIIKGASDILAMAWEKLTPELRAEQLSSIGRAAERAASMVDDLLALARFDDRTAEPGTTDVRATVGEVIAAAELRSDEHVDVTGEFAGVAAPAADVKAVLTNLLDNARHYGRCADGSLKVLIAGSTDRGRVVVDVTDQGPGIPEEERSRVFDAFYRLPGSRESNPASTGVGLAIVRRAVERWGGAVDVQSSDGEGSTFRIVFPAAT